MLGKQLVSAYVKLSTLPSTFRNSLCDILNIIQSPVQSDVTFEHS